MIKLGDLVVKDGITYRITSVPVGEVETYSLLALHKKDVELKKTVETNQIQSFLIPSGSIITGVSESDLGDPIGAGSAITNTVEDGYVKVIFESCGGTEIDPQVIEVGDGVVAPDNPTKEGYTFSGWYSNEEGTGDAYNFGTATFDVDTYVYAVYTINSYAVTFDSNEGSEVTAQNIEYGSTVNEPDDPTLAESEFAGWFSDEELTEEYDFSTPVTEAITLYAKWV